MMKKFMRKCGCGETLRKSNEVAVRRSSWIIHCLYDDSENRS